MENDDIERVLAARDAPVADLGRETCALILRLFPDAVVTVDGNDIAKAHITLGFAGGASLPDPAGLMEGRGPSCGSSSTVRLREAVRKYRNCVRSHSGWPHSHGEYATRTVTVAARGTLRLTTASSARSTLAGGVASGVESVTR
ncbi:hypothetical protein [Streptomyces sp. GESEQ-4]|uniref:hypothetical protein n=1 Tax=Streptomyces sp. GESEQ-4 TaxID=2812655 RepID=UPI001B32A7AB|nr:hypothetical protein [Streptomyces sp. GESEQ-4]